MNILAIDTATPHGSIALQSAGSAHLWYEAGTDHYSSRLYRWLSELQENFQNALESLDAIVITSGPGTFTGLRIGLATAKGLALANHCPIVAIPTLKAIAKAATVENETVCACINAGRGEVAAALYRLGQEPVEVARMETMSPEEITGFSHGNLIVGPGIDMLGNIHRNDATAPRLANHVDPVAPALLSLVAQKPLPGSFGPGHFPELHYIRAAVS